ncbi:MAG TPA: DUF6049 family protein, partial [Streptosporangiaceae bacterium]
ILITPPRRWNPPRRLASGLLAETVSAPWLRPVTANQLTAMRAAKAPSNLTSYSSSGEISGALLKRVSALEKRIALLQSIQAQPDPDLNRAVFGIESSAWRGKAGKHARLLLARTAHYVTSQLNGLSIRGSNGKHSALHVIFGGRSSSVPVAIYNSLRYTVRVKLLVHATNATVSGVPPVITVPPASYSRPVKITVQPAKNRHGTIRLSLISPDGRALPADPLTIVVRTTDLGVIALIIGSAGLALFVIASAMRAIRSGRPSPAAEAAAGPAESGAGAGAGTDTDAGEPAGAAATEVGLSGGAAPSGPAESGADSEADPDPGRDPGRDLGRDSGRGPDQVPAGPAAAHSGPPVPAAQEFPAQDLVQTGSRPEHIDSAGTNGSGLAPAVPSFADAEPTPGRRGNREHP